MFSQKPLHTPKESPLTFFNRLHCLLLIFVFLTIALACRLAWLQLFQFKQFETLSLKNQMTIIPIPPPRGIIVDRQGVVLAENIPVYSLEIIPEHVSDMRRLLKTLRQLLPSISKEDITQFKRAVHQNRAYVSIPLKFKLSQEEVALFATQQYRFSGVSVHARLMRHYPWKEMTAHLLGYVSRINIDELRRLDPVNYRGTNFIGKSGIEKYYENKLHGQVGYQEVETDVSGRTIRTLNKKNPQSGEKLELTIDMRLQEAAYRALENKRGALVAIDPNNGEILAFVSTPGFNPNHFIQGIKEKEYRMLSTDKAQPLYNRAARGLYPPASTIKPYVALAGLEHQIVSPLYAISDPGWYRIPGMKHAYRDWRKSGHGIVNVRRAIMVSCDTYFYQLGQKLGITAMSQFLSQFGFGQLTGVDLLEEASGILPNAQWKKKIKKTPWYPGDTVISAIGQGFNLATPLQIATAVATLSQKGKRQQPHFLYRSIQNDKQIVHYYQSPNLAPIQINNAENWQIVIEGMSSVINNNEGTGYRFGRTAPYTVAAKTGTAQVFSGHQYEKTRYENIPEYLRDHSLFIAFAPVEKPDIALAVVVENDVIAAHVARIVMDRYFELKKQAHDETS